MSTNIPSTPRLYWVSNSIKLDTIKLDKQANQARPTGQSSRVQKWRGKAKGDRSGRIYGKIREWKKSCFTGKSVTWWTWSVVACWVRQLPPPTFATLEYIWHYRWRAYLRASEEKLFPFGAQSFFSRMHCRHLVGIFSWLPYSFHCPVQ